MKRMKRFFVGMLCIVAVLFLEQNTYVVNALSHSYVLDENLQPVQLLEGQMPATGNAGIAVFLVDFQDIKHDEEHTKEYMESMFFGETKSLQDYFERESNGKLEISGDVYGWYTFEHERAYYENSASDKLLEELVEKYDKEIDFSKYDSDKDGFLDGIYFVAAGQDNGFANDWWPHVGGLFPMVSCDNVKMIQATIINEYTQEDTIIHETGHMLGLDDYYDTGKGSGTNYFGGDTLMATNETDVDPLSKILLGWATPRYISDTSKVMLSSADVNSDMMVIYPKGEVKSDYFFIVQYHTEDRASAYERREEGLCVYRVNLKKNDENNYFKYGVTDADPKRIELIAEGLLSGDAISPYTTPNTHFVCEENDEIVWLPSGITINNIVTNGDTVSFDVVYEDIISKDIKYETRIMAADNRIYMELSFASDMYVVNEDITIYAKDGDSSSPISFYRKKYPNANNRNVFILDTEEMKCKKDTEYTIIIPAKTLMSSYGKYNEDIVLKVRTSDYTELQTVTDREDVQGNVNCVSGDRILLEGDRYVYFAMKDDNLYMIESSMNGIVSERFIAQIEDYNLSKNFRNIEVRRFENGEYVVLQYSECTYNVFRIRADYTVERIEGLSECYELYTVGEQAVFVPDGFHEQTNFALVTDNNEVIVKEIDTPSGYVRDIYHMEDGLYLIAPGSGNYVSIVDEELNIVKCGRVQGIEDVLYATGYDDVYVFIGYDKGVKAYFVNKDLELLYTKEILYTDNVYQFDGIYKVENGYAIAIMFDRTYYNDAYGSSLSGWVSSPISGVIFLDEKFEKVTSCTVDYEGGNLGDRIETVFDFGDGRYGFSTMWATYMTDKIDLTSTDSTIEAIFISENSTNLIYGEQKQLYVRDGNNELISNDRITWISSDEKIVSVSDGVLSVHANGKATVSAYVEDLVVSCEVITEGAPEPIRGIAFPQGSSIGIDQEFRVNGLQVAYEPYYAEEPTGEVVWKSSDESIFLVEQAIGFNRGCVVYPVGNGTAILSAEYAGFETSIIVNVTNAEKINRSSDILEIVAQSGNKKANLGDKEVFSVAAKGEDLNYQWQYMLPGSSDWKDLETTDANTLCISVDVTAEKDGQQFRCVITDKYGEQVITEASTLVTTQKIEIITQPQNVVVDDGNSAEFNVEVSGTKLLYQWQYMSVGSNDWQDSKEPGANTPRLSVEGKPETSGRLYRCIITDGIEQNVISNVVTLQVRKVIFAILEQPQSKEVIEGANAVFTVEASGSNLSYQWQYKNAGTDKWFASGMKGAKTNSITVQGTVARNGQQYRCIITEGSGNTLTSDAVTLTVESELIITAQPVNQSVKEGSSAVFKVEASGNNLSYQWQYQNAGTNKWFNSGMKGAKTNSITVQGTAARNGQQYRCIITDGSSKQLTSEAVTLTVESELTITEQPANRSVEEGDSAVFKVTATGSNLSYQWQYKNAGTNKWFNSGMKGAKTDSITVQGTAARNGQQYRCIITDGSGNTLTSEAVTLTVEMQFAITAQPVNQSVSEGNSAVFKVTATGSNLSYQWQYKNAGADKWINSGMKGAKTSSITVQGTAARNGQQYRCIITDGSGNTLTSEAVTLTVEFRFAITEQPANRSVSEGNSAVFKVTATGSNLSYQWQYKNVGANKWINSGMKGAKTASITVQGIAARNGQQYRCIITDGSGNTLTSEAATMAVN